MNFIKGKYEVIVKNTAVSLVGLILFLGIALLSSPAIAQIHNIAEMTAKQIDSLDRERTVIILTGGILEEHGPYLPSFTDGYVNERLAKDLAEAIVTKPGWNAVHFPTIPLGNGGANEIGAKYKFSGTFSVRASTLRAVFMDLSTEIGDQGFRWIFVVHGHGAPNHNRMLNQAGEYFHDTFGGEMVHLRDVIVPGVKDFRTQDEKAQDGFSVHAGMNETSRLLYLRPDLVSAAVGTAPSQAGVDWEELEQIARKRQWSGYFGAPALANASHGARIVTADNQVLVDLALSILGGFDYRTLSNFGEALKTSPVNVKVDAASLTREANMERMQRQWLLRRKLQ